MHLLIACETIASTDHWPRKHFCLLVLKVLKIPILTSLRYLPRAQLFIQKI